MALIRSRWNSPKIYILLSIKTRIETLCNPLPERAWNPFISYYPLKQGLKPARPPLASDVRKIYILLSIKTRIETFKRWSITSQLEIIYILLSIKTRIETCAHGWNQGAGCQFISYYPLKQGLKLLQLCRDCSGSFQIYILLSIKTRIETLCLPISPYCCFRFISYYPLKQGLKPAGSTGGREMNKIYILLSIKTRIETFLGDIHEGAANHLYPTIH